MKLAGDLAHVLVYGLLLLTAFVFISNLVLISADALIPWTVRAIKREARPKVGLRTKMVLVFMLLASAGILFYLIRSMFFQFYMFETKANQIDLKFSWPRPSTSISRTQFQSFKIESDRNGNAQLFLFANGNRYASVAFDRSVDTNEIRSKLLTWEESSIR